MAGIKLKSAASTQNMMDDQHVEVDAGATAADGSPSAFPSGVQLVWSYSDATAVATPSADTLSCDVAGVKGQVSTGTLSCSFTNADGTVATGTMPFNITIDPAELDVADIQLTAKTPVSQ